MKRSRRVDNPSAQEKSKTYFLRKIKANLKTGFFLQKKTNLILEYPNRFKERLCIDSSKPLYLILYIANF